MYRTLVRAFGSPITGRRGGNTIRPKTLNLVLDGNSLTFYAGSWSSYIAGKVKSGYTTRLVNYAVGGQTTRQMNADADTQVDIPINKDKSHNIVVCMEGLNDLYKNPNDGWSAAYNGLRTYCLNRRAYGFKVIISTITPCAYINTPANYETNRLLVNAEIRNNWQTFADALADVGGDSIMGDPATLQDPYYYAPDFVHLASGGAIRISDIVAVQLNSLIP